MNILCENCGKRKANQKFRSICVCERCEDILSKEEKEFRGSDLEEYEEYDEEDTIIPKKKKNPEHVSLEIVEPFLPFAVLGLLITAKRALIKKAVYNALRNSFENIQEHCVYIALDELRNKKMVMDDITGFKFTEKGLIIYKKFLEMDGTKKMIRQN
jgi:hypothetical protein